MLQTYSEFKHQQQISSLFRTAQFKYIYCLYFAEPIDESIHDAMVNKLPPGVDLELQTTQINADVSRPNIESVNF